MWELIRLNRRKSIFLFIFMGFCLVALGYAIGMAFIAPPNGGLAGISIALAIWIIWSLIGYYSGDSILLSLSGAREVKQDVHPQLFNVVEEMKIAAGLPAMPKVYIIDEAAPNAFAVGRRPDKCAIAVTAGLLAKLNRDELQGVVAHETGHIRNRDIMFMTFSGIMLGSIVIISEVFLRGLWFSGGTSNRYRSRSDSRGGGQAQAIIMLVAIIFAILAPILAQLLYFAISRRREYLADATGVRLTRYPEGLASALEKISKSSEDLPKANKVTAPMYLVNPLKQKGMKMSDLTSTHPPITERIKILRAMSQGAGLNNYQEAFSRVKGQKQAIIPQSGLKETAAVPIRAKGAEETVSAKTQKRDLGDLMRAVNQYTFLACASCGLKIKLPPDFKKSSFPCPRCKNEIKVPIAELATAAAVLQGVQKSTGGQIGSAIRQNQAVYRRKGTGWESFSCSCGNLMQLSPIFSGTQMTCRKCGQQIRIEG